MLKAAFFLLAVVSPHSVAPAQARIARSAAPPSLVVLITIDQLRGDYLDRFGSQLTGGLARLVRGGAWFTNAHHDHAITETAPGHATLLSGRFPRSTGITANRAGVFDTSARLLDTPDQPGASPHQFRGTTLIDWLRARDARSRAFSVSMKDRGAILPIGRLREQVYWYVPTGMFTTSTYYADSLPSWVKRFNNRRLPQSFAGRSWVPLLPDSAYRERDSVHFENRGANVVFPHRVSSDTAVAASEVRVTPWMDDIVLAFAVEGLRELSLGKGRHTDVLAVSLSATDIVGHSYGPDSKEIHDQMLRLDRALGSFLDSVYKSRDPSSVVVILTSDHGVGTIPELAAERLKPAPARVNLSASIARLRSSLREAKVDTLAIAVDQQIVTANRAVFGKSALTADAALAAFARDVRAMPGIARVDRFADLAADSATDPTARRWMHQFREAADAVELVITQTPMSLWSTIPASHGSPYDYDTHVPLIFYGSAFRPGRYPEFVRTVDLAPTIAVAVGLKPPERLDGVILKRALK